MRRWILVAGVAVAAMLATACSSSGGTSSSSTSGPVTLTVWHNYGTEQNATALKNLAAAFHKLHPNVTVNVVSQPADNYFALLQAAAVSKTGPDLAVMWTGLFTLQYKDFLTNLQGKVPASALARIDPDALKWTSNDFNASNGPYVIPLENQFYIGFYNKAAFAKAGVSAVPTDWNQLFAACKKLQGRRVHAADLRQRRPAAGGRVLPLVRHELHDDRLLSGVRVAEAVQRADPVDVTDGLGPAQHVGQAEELRLHQQRRADQDQQPGRLRERQGRHDDRRHLGHPEVHQRPG